MLQPILTSLRRLFEPQFMRNIDQYLLTHHALVWETRVHWFTLYATALLLLLVGVGCCVQISFPDEITHFKTIEESLAVVQASVFCIVGLFFSLLVNGLFARFFKTGFIAANQKTQPIDFFKLAGIYGGMVVFAAVACSAYHYTMIVRTHFIINQKENYALLDKYAKIYEFYQQDTLRIKGFETIEPYINAKDLGYSTIELSHNYTKILRTGDTMLSDPRIKAYYYNEIGYVPINQALYRLLPKKSEFYKLRKNTFEEVQVYLRDYEYNGSAYDKIRGKTEAEIMALTDMNENNVGNKTNIPLFQKLDIINNIDNKTCGFPLNDLNQNLTQYCRFTHYSTPHTILGNQYKDILLDKDTVSINIVKKRIDDTHYENHNNYWRFFAKQSLIILLAAVFFVVLFLSLHAHKSIRFFTLTPFAVLFLAIIVEQFTHDHRQSNIVQSGGIFYLVFMLALVFWQHKAYNTNALKFAIIYIVPAIFCTIPLMGILPDFSLDDSDSDATRLVNIQNILVPTLLFVHILLYLFVLVFRNTRLSIITPFLYFLAFVWSLLPNALGLYHYHSNQSAIEPNFLVNLCTTFAFVPFFLVLNLLSAPFLLSAIVRQTQAPK